ncbi:MAG: hypothetical protein IKT68_02760 [Clostridia bacterium]|nr:hypothetical protein [Clostridia bacterium]
MDDLSTMLAGIMNSPEQMEKLKAMAGNLFGSAEPSAPMPQQPADISAGEIAGLMKMANLLKNNTNDRRAGVLLALRPYLTEHRQKRVDDAVKILRLINILPAVKEAGIL